MDNVQTGKLIAELRKQQGLTQQQLSLKEKIKILFAALAGLGAGGVLGIIAYYQQWLG